MTSDSQPETLQQDLQGFIILSNIFGANPTLLPPIILSRQEIHIDLTKAQDVTLHYKFSSNIVLIAHLTLTASMVRTYVLNGVVEGLVYTRHSLSAAAKSDVWDLSLRQTIMVSMRQTIMVMMMSACSPSYARCGVMKRLNASLTPALCRRVDGAKVSQA